MCRPSTTNAPEIRRAGRLQQALQQSPRVLVARDPRAALDQQVDQRRAAQAALRGRRRDGRQQLHRRHRRLAVEPQRLLAKTAARSVWHTTYAGGGKSALLAGHWAWTAMHLHSQSD